MKKFFLSLLLSVLAAYPFYCEEEVKLRNIFLTDTADAQDYIEPENIPLKGYAEFIEDSEVIRLKDEDNQFVLNLKVPQKIEPQSLAGEDVFTKLPVLYSKYGAEEYQIHPKDASDITSSGKFTFGTNMEQEVDFGELEHTANFFTRFDKGRFGFETAYERTIGSTYNNYFDNLYVAPELKINKFLSLKEVLTADMTRNRRKAEFVLSVKPLAHTKENRLNFEFGASQTYDDSNALIRKQLKFNTRFKL